MQTINPDRSKYAWLLGWVMDLDPGTAHLARKGHEFTCDPSSFASVVYAAANQRGFKATVQTFDNVVVFSFYRESSYLKPNLAAYPVVKKMRRVQ